MPGDGGIEYQGPRLAPSPESREKSPALDVVVVIPCHNEWPGILRTLGSIARQEKGKEQVLNGAVVVINNKPTDAQEVQGANMTTYATLQLIRKGYPVDVGDEDLNEDIKDIQEKNLHLEIIDAFSNPHAHPESNVGRARKIGTEQGLSMLKQDPSKEGADRFDPKGPGIISTDGDTTLSEEVAWAVNRVLAENYADAVALGTGHEYDGLDQESKEASNRYSLYWKVQSAHQQAFLLDVWFKKFDGLSYARPRPSFIEKELVTMGGGYAAYSAHFYVKSGGYDETRGTAEDTELSHAIAAAGGVIKDIRKRFPNAYAYTQPRVSFRTEKGYGHTIGKWSPKAGELGDVQVPAPMGFLRADAFLKDVDFLSDNEEGKKEFEKLCEQYEIAGPAAEALITLYRKWDGMPNNREHFELVERVNDYFKEDCGQVPMKKFIYDLEESTHRASLAMTEKFSTILEQVGAPDAFYWDEFWSYGEQIFDGIEVLGEGMTNDLRETFRAYRASEFVEHMPQALDTLKVAAYAFGQKRPVMKKSGERMVFVQDGYEPIETVADLEKEIAKLTEEQKTLIGQLLRQQSAVTITLALTTVSHRFPDLLNGKQRQFIDLLFKQTLAKKKELWKSMAEAGGWPSSV